MSWVARMIEQRLADAAASGELDAGSLQGKPIPGIDQQRQEGWWAEQFVQRELSHDRRKVAVEAVGRAKVQFWRADSVEQLHDLVAEANESILHANLNLVAEDRLETFEQANIRQRWLALRKSA